MKQILSGLMMCMGGTDLKVIIPKSGLKIVCSRVLLLSNGKK
jgi:hypothetical protein